jgi:serine/threonine protein kinase
MSTDHRLSELLLQWEELLEQGRPASAQELCRDCPELADELRRRIQALQAVPSVLSAPAPLAGGDATLSGESRQSGSLTADAATRPAEAEQPPRRLPAVPGYEVLGELGRGGMGVVYLAVQQGLNRRVALKMMLAGAHAVPAQRARFRSEVEAVARLSHPNVVQIFELGEQGGQLYCALELVNGGCLADRLDGSPWPPRPAAELVAALADGLQAAHDCGVIHRDLKPANVLLTAAGVPKISDFGLARLLDRDGQTESGAVLGTPQYMAPEQAQGQNRAVGAAADVHALGAILYELLTGRPPFRGTTTLETLLQVKALEPVRPRLLQPHVPRDLETICLKCLRKQPEQRYASARELAEDLRRFLRGEPVRARPPAAWERVLKWARRRPSAAALVGVSLLAVLALFLVVLSYNTRLRSQRDQADALRRRAETGEAAALARGQEAEANFRLARSVVDDYTLKLSETDSWLVDDLRLALLKSSLAYYEQFVKQRGADPALRDAQGRAYLRLAQISGELGAKESRALGRYGQAEEVFEQLLREQPGKADYQRELALVRYHLGRALLDLGQPQRAEEALQKARPLQEELVRSDPEAVPYRGELARTWFALGQACFQRKCGRPKVEAAFNKALAIMDEAAKLGRLGPAEKDLVGDVRHGLGNVYAAHHEYERARGEYLEALQIEKELVRAHPTVLGYQSDLGTTYYDLGRCYAALGRFDEARDSLKKSLEIRQALADAHRRVTQFAADLGATLQSLAGFIPKAQERYEAYSKAIATLEAVLAREPSHREARTNLAAAYAGRAGALDRLGRHAEALQDWDRLQKLGLRWGRDGTLGRAKTLAHLGKHKAAAGIAFRLDNPRLSATQAISLARVYAVCAEAAGKDTALPAQRRKQAVEANAARAVALLARASAAGSFKTAEQRKVLEEDPDFAALRARADFKKLLRGPRRGASAEGLFRRARVADFGAAG